MRNKHHFNFGEVNISPAFFYNEPIILHKDFVVWEWIELEPEKMIGHFIAYHNSKSGGFCAYSEDFYESCRIMNKSGYSDYYVVKVHSEFVEFVALLGGKKNEQIF